MAIYLLASSVDFFYVRILYLKGLAAHEKWGKLPHAGFSLNIQFELISFMLIKPLSWIYRISAIDEVKRNRREREIIKNSVMM